MLKNEKSIQLFATLLVAQPHIYRIKNIKHILEERIKNTICLFLPISEQNPSKKTAKNFLTQSYSIGAPLMCFRWTYRINQKPCEIGGTNA